MKLITIQNVVRVKKSSPVLYRRYYSASARVENNGKDDYFPFNFVLERDALGRWKPQIQQLDKNYTSVQDELVQGLVEMEQCSNLL